MKKRIIYLIGIDGAGKTTLSKNLIKEFSVKNIDLGYLYLRHFPFLLYPLKFLGKKSILKNTNEFKNYEKYYDKKISFFTKHKILANIYALIWILDYLLITYFRMIKYFFSDKVFIVDRYYYDQIVNISDSINVSIEKIKGYFYLFEKILPKPNLLIYLDLPPETAFLRKDDIQSISYLKTKIKKYKFLLDKKKHVRIDASLPQEDLLKNTITIVRGFLEKN